MVERFGVELLPGDDVVILAVAGEIDAATSPSLRDAMLSALTLTDRLVLDASGVTFMDSSALHVLIRTQQTAGGAPSVVVRNPSDQVRRLLQLTGLTTHLLESPTQSEHRNAST